MWRSNLRGREVIRCFPLRMVGPLRGVRKEPAGREKPYLPRQEAPSAFALDARPRLESRSLLQHHQHLSAGKFSREAHDRVPIRTGSRLAAVHPTWLCSPCTASWPDRRGSRPAWIAGKSFRAWPTRSFLPFPHRTAHGGRCPRP